MMNDAHLPRNVVLIGNRGSGKTSVGRALATRLGWTPVDTDALIQQQTGRTIADIFATEGEPRFRALESAAIAGVVRGAQQVISVGGGAVVSESNRGHLRSAGVCVWLTAPPEELLRRMRQDPNDPVNRPALTQREALDEVRHLLGVRTALYAELAQLVVDTTGQSLEDIVDEIVTFLKGE